MPPPSSFRARCTDRMVSAEPHTSDPTGAPEPLREAEGDRVEGLRPGGGGDPRRDHGVPEARAVEVQREAQVPRRPRDVRELRQREDAPAAGVVGVLDADRAGGWEVALVGRDGRAHVAAVEQAAAADGLDVNPRERGRGAGLVLQDVGVRAGQDEVSRPRRARGGRPGWPWCPTARRGRPPRRAGRPPSPGGGLPWDPRRRRRHLPRRSPWPGAWPVRGA